ncbi:MAG: hypothetical protein AAB519_03750 [Patescibacteria group bacterium]
MDLEQYLKKITHGGFRSFIRKTAELGVQCEFIYSESSHILKLSYGGKSIFCHKSNLPVYRRMGNLTKNKEITKTILGAIGIKTPRGIVANTLKDALKGIESEKLPFPLLCKPLSGSLAKGVTWNLTSLKELKSAVQWAQKAYNKKRSLRFLIEEMFVGKEYRVLVFDKKVLSCVEKIPAGLTGDGHSTLEELIHTFNKTRVKGFEIKLDKTARETLKREKLSLESVLPEGYFLKLRNNLNMSDGGRAIDRTLEMSPVFREIAERAIEAVGLTYGGLDFLADDITKSESDYVILEINPNPFYNMHEKPLVEGRGVDVSKTILKSLFPTLT